MPNPSDRIQELAAQFAQLSARLGSIERRLSRLELGPPPPLPTGAPSVGPPTLPHDPGTPSPERASPAPVPREPSELPRTELVVSNAHAHPFAEHPRFPQAPPTLPPPIPELDLSSSETPGFVPRGPGSPPPSTSLERLIGGKFYLVAGSIVVVIGVGLFLKLGYDAGWFRMAPVWKCLWGALFGIAMLLAGELARRRVSILASAGITGAGMGALFASTYAAHGLYAIIGPSAAFALLAGVTAIGITVSARARLLSVALLTIIGGYLSPFLLTVTTPNPYVLPLHLLALLVVGLTLSAWRATPFRPLRSVVWWGTLLIGSFWLVSSASGHPELGILFLAAVWSAVHTELIAGARRAEAARGADPDAPDEPVTLRAPLLAWHVVRPVGVSFSTSAWTAFMGVLLLRLNPVLPDWFIPAGILCGAVVLSIILVGNLRLLRDIPATESERLGAGLVAQAGAMLIAVVALAFQGWLELSSWLALGFAATAAAAWIRSRGLGVYGVVVLSIALARLVTYDAFVLRTPLATFNALGLVLDRWTLLALIASLACGAATLFLATLGTGSWAHFARRLVPLDADATAPPEPAPAEPDLSDGATCEPSAATRRAERLTPWNIFVRIAAIASIAILFGALVHPENNPASQAAAWIVLGLGLLFAHVAQTDALSPPLSVNTAPDKSESPSGALLNAGPFAPTSAPHFFGTLSLAGLSATTALWLRSFVAAGWTSTAHQAPFHLAAFVAAGLAAAFLALAWVFRRGRTTHPAIDPHAGLSLLFATGIAWTAISLETSRLADLLGAARPARVGWMLASWVALAASLELLRRWMRWRPLLHASIAVLGAGSIVAALSYTTPSWSRTASEYAVHPALLVATLLVAGLLRGAVHVRLAHAPANSMSRALTNFCYAAAGVLAFGASSLEIARQAKVAFTDATVQQAAVSIWWGGLAAALLAVGFAKRWSLARYGGLGLLGVATVKAVALDLADVPPVWRVVSVLGLGMLMLGVAVVYARVSDTLLRTSTPSGT